jgi:hypothetical protein
MILGNCLVLKKGAPEQVYVHEGTLEDFWSVIAGGAHQQYYPEPQHPSVSLMDVQKDFGENERDKDNQQRVELALRGFDCQAANRPHSPRGVTSPCWLSL